MRSSLASVGAEPPENFEDRVLHPSKRETIGAFLLRRLRELGVSHIFGVAGDFNLEFLEQLAETPGMQWVGCCNELNAAYAADGHARTCGLSALVTTYGVGDLSAICGVAGSYAEHLPVVAIVGAPPLADIERKNLMHHTGGSGDFRDMMTCGAQFSRAHARITPQTAAIEIDRCLISCVREKRPVYLQLPSDIAYLEIEVPSDSLLVDFKSNERTLRKFESAADEVIRKSASTALLIDADVIRYKLSEKVTRLAERLRAGIAVMGTAKGAVDEDRPQYLGVYSGAYSRPEVRETIETAECLIQVAVRFTDATTGAFSQKLRNRQTIELEAWRARVQGEDIYGVFLGDALDHIVPDAKTSSVETKVPTHAEAVHEPSSETISQKWFWKRIEEFLRAGDVIAAENGTSLTGILGVRFPRQTTLLAQALWGSIGYTLPATFGSLIGSPDRRHLLFIGDGSFQLTAQELSSILRHNLKPIIFLINNDGYTIERLILGETRAYNDIQPWRYAELCGVFAAGTPFITRTVHTPNEVETALQLAEQADCCVFIEVVMDRMDAPEALRTLGRIYARQDYGSNYNRI
jgi:indolepyruvate decarboxylase